MIGNLLQVDLEEIIKSKDWNLLREVLSELDPPDIAEILVDIPPEDEGVIFRVLPRERAAAVFSYLPLERQQDLVDQPIAVAAEAGVVHLRRQVVVVEDEALAEQLERRGDERKGVRRVGGVDHVEAAILGGQQREAGEHW